jgi:solute:Na+ symporter, SSS family
MGYLTIWDLGVLALFLIAMTGIGLHFRRRQTSTQEFFLGSRKIPVWAAGLSFVATEVSAVTVISVPATAFMENWEYLQFFIGSAAARILIAYLFIPAFYRTNVTTIYEFLAHRFGVETQVAGSFFFFLTRLLGSGVRLMAACLAFSVLFGWPMLPTLGFFTVVSILYIGMGGIRAVVWTNAIQGTAILGGGLATAVFLAMNVEGGAAEIIRIGENAGRLAVLDWGPKIGEAGFWKQILTNPNILWLAILNGLFGSLAAFGTDHELMQRLLTVETRRESQKSMLLTIPVSLGVLLIYLSVGAGLFAFYAQNPSAGLPQKMDAIFPHFIGNAMPAVLKGLLLSVIVLASIDSPLASLTASFVTDVYKPLRRRRGLPELEERRAVRISRIGVIVFGVVLMGVAYGFSFFQKILWLAFKIGGVTFGSLLGVFLLGLLTNRPSNRANVWAMVASALTMLVLLILSETRVLPLGWSWLIILGTCLTFALAWVLGPRMEPAKSEV